MKILIVSGFLGAGKTTFIKELIKRTGTNPVVLENEYGDNTIDVQDLKQTDKTNKLEILEFMEGCVCCTMKDSFINSVLTAFSALSPEYLIVEPTGVGKLSNIIENLQPIMHGNISLLKPIVILSPRSYRQNMSEWPELYRDQVANAQIVVFSKCESEMPEVLAQTEEAITSINPTAEIIHEHYSGQSEDWWRSLMELPAKKIEIDCSDSTSESISQITLNHAKLENPAQLVMMLEDCLRGEFGHIARAKGNIPVGSETLRFDLADGLYSITDSPETTNQCVFIGETLNKAGICERMGSSLQKESLIFVKPSISRKERLKI